MEHKDGWFLMMTLQQLEIPLLLQQVVQKLLVVILKHTLLLDLELLRFLV